MYILNLGEIDAVAFDIDGTLYRNLVFYIRVLPHYLKHWHFFIKFNKVRKILRADKRNEKGYNDLFRTQIGFLAKELSCTLPEAEQQLNDIVYEGLRPYFEKINACHGAAELIHKLKAAGVKIALLSDFPPEQKGEIWGIKKDCDLLLSSELIGALKPSSKPFEELAEKLEVPADRILYIGNSHKYDIAGPKKLGIKAGWFVPWIRGMFGIKSKIADITFWRYRQLDKFIFKDSSD
ncbi:MAG: HAD family hydrolase [Treponema sp.]|nr:HAD family hydrolase [Treponema sp.]